MKQKYSWWSVLLWVAFACVAVFMSVKSSIVSIDTGRSQRSNQQPNYSYTQDVGNKQLPSTSVSDTARTTNIAEEKETEESLSLQLIGKQDLHQYAQKIFAYLQNHKYLEATWTAASGETRGAIAGTRAEIRGGFAVLTKIETLTEDGRPGDSYDVWMVDENSDGVLDAIMYVNSRNQEEKHAYHHPTDEASMLHWKLSLRELAKAAR